MSSSADLFQIKIRLSQMNRPKTLLPVPLWPMGSRMIRIISPKGFRPSSHITMAKGSRLVKCQNSVLRGSQILTREISLMIMLPGGKIGRIQILGIMITTTILVLVVDLPVGIVTIGAVLGSRESRLQLFH